MERTVCPVCGRDNAQNKKVFERDFSAAAEIVPFSRYDVFACANCGFVYAGNLCQSMPLDRYYNELSRYENDNFVLSEEVGGFYQRAAAFIAKTTAKDAAILDIGCAFGGLLNELRKQGFEHLAGIELSERNVDYARNHFGLDVSVGGLGMQTERNEKFDLVILTGTLEHILPIRSALAECVSFLNPQGQIFISVPDMEQFHLHDDLYQEFSAEHINYFSKNALERLFFEEAMHLLDFEKDAAQLQGQSGSLFTMWRLGKHDKAVSSDRSIASLELYLDHCKSLEEKIRQRMRNFDLEQGYYIWGAGSHTGMMYQLRLIEPDKILGVVDANQNYWGKCVYGHTIEAPEKLKEVYRGGVYPDLVATGAGSDCSVC